MPTTALESRFGARGFLAAGFFSGADGAADVESVTVSLTGSDAGVPTGSLGASLAGAVDA